MCHANTTSSFDLEVDQAAGFVKTSAKRAVIINTDLVISDAKELYDFAQSHLSSRQIGSKSSLFKRRFFYVDEQDVTRERMALYTITVKGTQRLHSTVCQKSNCTVN